ncbi:MULTISPECIES: coiled-coil domain-containing protein [Leifsonia]|uniref:Uncharacterized protein n=3 Tax=Bacteria TaxID=2 RepID=A0A7W4UZQ4_LEIAQ|nr:MULTISPECIES: hypothetical protein [Leifsonia]MBB2969270.1 hypothetical protein [Leifsonia aquatica]MBO1740071.1 hypothetical protein [Leifsonia sp. TF02-11]
MISSVLVVQASPAQADNYPSWNDVLAARATEAGKKAQVAAITALISGLKEKVKAAEDEAASRERDNERAQAAFTAGQDRATRLATNAASLQTQADASGKHAAAVAAKFVRTGSGNLTGTLLVSTTSNRAGLLYRLSVLGKLSSTVDKLYSQAARDSNLAKAASDQANSARDALASLAAAAKSALANAVKAQQSLISSLSAQTAHEGELEAQLASLSSATAVTEQQYQAGVAARAAAAAAAARAAAEAARQAGPNAPVASDARALAQELMGYVAAGQLSGSYPDHIMEIRWIAEGRSVPNCGIDTQVLQAIVIAMHTFSNVGVSDINRKCTGQIEGAGIYSQHYAGGGGHAVDFYSLGGRASTGADANSLALIGILDPRMPFGSGLGQSNCRAQAGNEPRLRNFQDFYDTCNHLHINDPM